MVGRYALKNSRESKGAFMVRFDGLFDVYNKIILVDANNVSSAQMNSIRKSLRGDAVLIMGKNTIMRKVMREALDRHPLLEELIPLVVGNLGMVFTNKEVADIRTIIASHKKGAAAKVGSIAPLDVIIPAGSTGLEPTLTSFFAALAIPTQINNNSIEITDAVHLIVAGTKVGSSEATLLQKLDIRPFAYGLDLHLIYDNGVMFSPRVLDITDEDLVDQFRAAVQSFANVSLAISYPIVASVPLFVKNAMAQLVTVAVGAGYEIEQNKDILAYLADPEAYLATVVVAAPVKEEKVADAAAANSEESSDDDMGFDMFG